MRGRRLRPWVTAATAAALLAAMGCTPDGQKPADPTTAAATKEPVSITLAVYGAPNVLSAYADLAKSFTAEHPTVAVKIRPFSTHDEMMRSLRRTAGTPAAPDLFLSDEDDLPWLESVKANRPVNELLAERNIDFGDSYERTGLEAFSSADALQCMPIEVSPLMVYYNARLVHLPKLRPVGEAVPNAETGWRWSDFLEAVRQASTEGRRGVYIAPSLAQLAPFLLSDGGKLVDDETDPTTLTLADDSNREALDQVLELVRNRDYTYTRSQLAASSPLERFKSGKLAMILGHRDLTPGLRAQKGLTFGVMPLPRLGRSATVADIRGLCLSSTSEHSSAAADLLAYLVSDSSSKKLASTGSIVPANTVALHSDEFTQGGQDPIGNEAFEVQNRYVRDLPDVVGWEPVVAGTTSALTRLFYVPAIDPLVDRLTAIDEVSARIFQREAPSASPTPSPSPTPTD